MYKRPDTQVQIVPDIGYTFSFLGEEVDVAKKPCAASRGLEQSAATLGNSMIFAAYQNLLILFTTRPSTSPAADVSAPPQKINLSTVFVGQAVGIKEVEEGIGLVSFMDYDLGYIDLEEKTLQPLEPFWPKSVTYVSGTICNEAVKKPR